ncbi:MAG: hypothetical protein RLZ44_1207 [Pseudomonadota bacterium]|jgi:predicted Fe-Mo cluster-binding NifX family protein
MRVAVTSQNFRTVTGHAGKTRRFLIYEVDAGGARETGRLDLPKQLSFHEFQGDVHPIDGVDLLVTGGCGEGFRQKMARRGIRVVVTDLTEPTAAALAACQADR